MAHASTFDGLFGSSAPIAGGGPARAPRWYASPEAWITLALVVLAQVPVIGSLQSARWVAEMPSLMLAATLGLLGGWVLAHSRWPAVLTSAAGALLGAVTVLGLVLQRMVLTDPLLGSGPRAHWQEFVLRMGAWVTALLERNVSTDPLPFVLLLVALVFVVAYMSSWAVVRWRNAWAALIPGGFVLLTNISYLPGQPSLALIVYLLAAVLLVTRLEFLRSLARWRREQLQPPDTMSFEVLMIGGVVAAILVASAWIVPTANDWGPVADLWGRAMAPVSSRVSAFGELFVGINSKKAVPLHSFGPTLPLQGKVVLKPGALYEVTASEPGNLRGATYDDYTGAGWKLSTVAAVPIQGTTVQAAGFGTPLTRAQVRRPVTVEVTVLSEAAPDRRLLSVGDPIAADVGARQLVDPKAGPVGLLPDEPATAGSAYTTVGTVSAAAVATLQAAGTAYPPGLLELYTQLPATLPVEVAALARNVIGPARTPYEASRRVEAYLRANYIFTLDPPPALPRRDAVSTFLFDQRAGYFDQFASAMAVLLRTAGIPTRVATGFVLDAADLDAETKAYRVSEERAWTWPEVYFPGLGWVEFNPTPTRGLVPRAGDDSAALAAAAAALNAPADLGDLDGLLPEDFVDADGGLDGATAGFGLGRIGDLVVQAVSALLVLSAVGFVAAVAARIAWVRHFAGLAPAAARWGKVQRLAAWAGAELPDYLTPVEAARRLAALLGEGIALQALARAYTRERYGPARAEGESDEVAQAANADYRRVRDRLSRALIGRVLHFGRGPWTPLAGRYAAPATRPR